jgi:hypothetical protein
LAGKVKDFLAVDSYDRLEPGDLNLHLVRAAGLLVEGFYDRADPNTRDEVGQTQLHLAALHDDTSIVAALNIAGAEHGVWEERAMGQSVRAHRFVIARSLRVSRMTRLEYRLWLLVECVRSFANILSNRFAVDND